MFESSCENCRHSLTKASDTWDCLVCKGKKICNWCYVDHTALKHPNLNVVKSSKKKPPVTEAESRQEAVMAVLDVGFPT